MANNIPKIPPSPERPTSPPSKKAKTEVAETYRKVLGAQTPEQAAKELGPERIQKWVEAEKTTTEQKALEAFLTALQPLNPTIIKTVVTEMAAGLRALYIDAALGSKLAALLEKNLAEGKYDKFINPLALQKELNNDLRSLCSDKHLTVDYIYKAHPKDSPYRTIQGPSPEEEIKINAQEDIKQDFRPHFGITETKILPENIGYVKIDKFVLEQYEETKNAVDIAMRTVANAKALIIDLRDNNGGDPKTVALVASYLFDKQVLINETYDKSSKTASYYAHPEDFPIRFGGSKPIYILTSPKTFSAAEELAYDLQALTRAKVIGQTTMGGARPTRGLEVGEHFVINIPNEESKNPYKKGANWEGTGVIPDIPLSEDEDARKVALDRISKEKV